MQLEIPSKPSPRNSPWASIPQSYEDSVQIFPLAVPLLTRQSGEDGDLEKTFYLLRRQPGVLDRSQRRSENVHQSTEDAWKKEKKNS